MGIEWGRMKARRVEAPGLMNQRKVYLIKRSLECFNALSRFGKIKSRIRKTTTQRRCEARNMVSLPQSRP